MTALFMDGFDHYGSGSASRGNMLDGVWAEFNGGSWSTDPPSWGAARTGTGCLTCSGQNHFARLVIPGAPAKMYISFGFAVDNLPNNGGVVYIHQARDVSNVIRYSLMLNSTGSISLWSGDIGSLLATSAGPVVRAQTWHFFEICIDYTAGTYTVRVDDSDASQAAALTTSISTSYTNAQMAFAIASTGAGFPVTHWDDLFIRNSAGTTNNSWLGDRRVATLMTNADTATAGWTPNYYQKFGAGVLKLANMQPNNNTPVNPNAYISAAGSTGFDTGSSDFTIESFVRFEQLPAAAQYATIFNRWDAANNHRSYRLILGGSSFNNGSLQFDYTTDGTAGTVATPIVFPWTPDLNVWYHIAIVRASNQLLLFVNGAQFGLPISVSATFFGAGGEPFSLGAEVGGSGVVSNTYLTGMYDETRFTNGFARYTTSFATPSAPFPRGSGSDAQWSNVVLLCGYDTAIADESSFLRSLTAANGATQYTVNDGAAVGAYSTINKAVPDDNTFISAALTAATNILTMTTQPANNSTVTVGTKSGGGAAVYTFKTAIATAYDVLIDTTAQNTLLNLYNAINAGTGAGTKYGTGTLANADVAATQLPAGQIKVTALTAGTVGNSIASTSTSVAATWATSTLTGGANIPGPSDFKVQRPPANTTIISAVQSTVRAYKSDSGTCVIQDGLVGPLGAVTNGATHALATNVGYYTDIFETDPDTAGPISPATLINGKLRINRTS